MTLVQMSILSVLGILSFAGFMIHGVSENDETIV